MTDSVCFNSTIDIEVAILQEHFYFASYLVSVEVGALVLYGSGHNKYQITN